MQKYNNTRHRVKPFEKKVYAIEATIPLKTNTKMPCVSHYNLPF